MCMFVWEGQWSVWHACPAPSARRPPLFRCGPNAIMCKREGAASGMHVPPKSNPHQRCSGAPWCRAFAALLFTLGCLLCALRGSGEGVLRSFKELDDVPVESWPSLQPTDDSAYMNHSCDPTGVFAPACMLCVAWVYTFLERWWWWEGGCCKNGSPLGWL